MFYCETCRELHGWPKGWGRSLGPCEMCGKVADCYDVPSRALPPVKREESK